MQLNFIIINLNVIVLAVWLLFFILVSIRFVRPSLVKNISYSTLLFLAFSLHILYGGFTTWAQYHAWSTGGPETKIFVSAPLPVEAPLPVFLGWTRSYFDQPMGYFAYYVFGHFWLNILILFLVAGFFYSVLKLWDFYRGRFIPKGPEILLILFLVSGWPGVLLLLPIALIFWAIFFVVSFFRGKRRVLLEPAFVIATPIALILGTYLSQNMMKFFMA
ncbi:MAG: hypothetical protein PHS95_00090 [Candidatus Pacebacteria bacterium]|nr:hypothetical protein [Candidatus Paceibacterota bacterium]